MPSRFGDGSEAHGLQRLVNRHNQRPLAPLLRLRALPTLAFHFQPIVPPGIPDQEIGSARTRDARHMGANRSEGIHDFGLIAIALATLANSHEAFRALTT